MSTSISKKIGFGFLFFLFVGGIAFGAYAIQRLNQRQSTTSEASSENILINWGSYPAEIRSGQSATIPITLNSEQYSFSAVQIKGRVEGVSKDKISLNSPTISGLSTVISQLDTTSNGTLFTLVYFSTAGNGDLFSTKGQAIRLAELSLNSVPAGRYTFQIERTESLVTSFTFPGLSLTLPSGGSILASDQAGTPDQGIHRSCNEYCADSRECQNNFTCYFNRCRNPKNLNAENCAEPTPTPTPRPATPRPVQRVATPRPTATPIPTPTPTPLATPVISGVPSITSVASPVTPSPIPTIVPATPTPTPTPTVTPAPITQPEKSGSPFVTFLIFAIVIGVGVGVGFFVLKKFGPKPSDY